MLGSSVHMLEAETLCCHAKATCQGMMLSNDLQMKTTTLEQKSVLDDWCSSFVYSHSCTNVQATEATGKGCESAVTRTLTDTSWSHSGQDKLSHLHWLDCRVTKLCGAVSYSRQRQRFISCSFTYCTSIQQHVINCQHVESR